MPATDVNSTPREKADGGGARPKAVPSDRDLLRLFATGRNGARGQTAFALLVRRHGPMVLATCRRVLHDRCAAEDALQATFLVLANRAREPGWQASIGGWLHRVAYRLAVRSRRESNRRARREDEVGGANSNKPSRAPNDPMERASARELCEAIDQELARLPARYRSVLVLCYLQGWTRDEAAEQLGWSPSTVKRTLDRARSLLRSRLRGRGFDSGTALAGALVTPSLSPAPVTAACAAKVAEAAESFAATGAVPAKLVGDQVAALTKGAIKAMAIANMKLAALLVAASSVLLGAGAATYVALAVDVSATAAAPAAPAVAPGVKKTLPGGGAVELVAVSLPDSEFLRSRRDNPAGRGLQPGAVQDQVQHWWSPDGTYLPEPGFRRFVNSVGHRHYEVVLRVEGLKDYDLTASSAATGWKPAGTADVERVVVPGEPRRRFVPDVFDVRLNNLEDWVRTAPIGTEKTTVRVAVAAGPWQDVEEWNMPWEKVDPVSYVLRTRSGVWFQWPRQKNGDVEMDAVHTYTDASVRMVAADKAGAAHVAERGMDGAGEGLRRCVFRFKGLKLVDIDTIKFQKRPYDRQVEFDGVELMPDHVREVMDFTPLKNLTGNMAPELRQVKGWKNPGALPRPGGPPATLAALRGRVVLLDFWNYGCGGCVENMPKLMDLHDRFKDKGLVVVGVHADMVESIDEMDRQLARTRQQLWAGRDIPFAVALDGGGRTRVEGAPHLQAWGATTAAYGVTSFPTTLLIDQQGRVVGPVNPGNVDQTRTAIVKLLRVD